MSRLLSAFGKKTPAVYWLPARILDAGLRTLYDIISFINYII